MSFRITRRGFGATLLAAPLVGPLAAPAVAQGRTAASLRLDWALSGYQIPFYWGVEKGFFAEEGIELDVRDGSGSAKAVNLVQAKEDTFGMADCMVTANSVARGVKAKSIFVIVQNGGSAIVSWAEKPMRTPQEMIGRSLAAAADQKTTLDLLLSANGIRPDQVTLRIVAVAARNTVFYQGQVEGIVSTVIGSPMDMVVAAREGKGKPIHIMPFADFGVKSMSQGLLVHDDTIAQNPDLVRRFTRAASRSVADCVPAANHDAATDVAMRRSRAPANRRDSVKLQWELTVPRLYTAATEGKPLGFTTDGDWENCLNLLVQSGAITANQKVPVNTIYTNAFIPA
ncbi:ABC transporter substrate-binding protein [Siccirubricoccus phaeus]|uniref:ABC transporter substrate-binding protein n=1 Tax=Siccirubricoccus phaeus TaxID=2595053 RepID=UPI0011F2EB14|nr:ABC transporter substrate-binding protein [Siccirubricoccus phaeus]